MIFIIVVVVITSPLLPRLVVWHKEFLPSSRTIYHSFNNVPLAAHGEGCHVPALPGTSGSS